jgi:hypothetical protein
LLGGSVTIAKAPPPRNTDTGQPSASVVHPDQTFDIFIMSE